MNSGDQLFPIPSLGSMCLTLIAICLLTACGDSTLPSAPIYAVELMDATAVEWKSEGEIISGGYKISHSGDPSHTYRVVVYIVSEKGKKLVSSLHGATLDEVNTYEWSDFDESARHVVHWPTARIWCEILIYGQSDNLLFHGVKTSDRFASTEGIEPNEE